MNCKQVRRRLSPYLDGELPDEVGARVRAHVAACARCAEELARLHSAGAALDVLPGMTVPGGFAQSVRELASRQAARARRAHRPAVFELWRAAPAPLRAAAMFALAFGLLSGGLMSGSTAAVRSRSAAGAGEDAEAQLSVEFLDPASPGSVADAYLGLASGSEGGEQ